MAYVEQTTKGGICWNNSTSQDESRKLDSVEYRSGRFHIIFNTEDAFSAFHQTATTSPHDLGLQPEGEHSTNPAQFKAGWYQDSPDKRNVTIDGEFIENIGRFILALEEFGLDEKLQEFRQAVQKHISENEPGPQGPRRLT